MKLFLSCAALFCLTASAFAEEPRTTASPSSKSIDGTWTVLSAEKDGQPMGEAKEITVTVKDNMITCRGKDGKEMKMKLEFTGPGMAKVTEEATTRTSDQANADKDNKDAKTGAKEAVYVLTNDFLAICVHHAKAEGDIKTASGTEASGRTASSKSYCSFVLQRSGGTERK